MRPISLLIAVILVAAPGIGADQEGEAPQPQPAVDHSNVEAVIEALYLAVSFEPSGEPDWATLRSLFLEGAVLAQPRRGTVDLELLSVEEFVARFKGDLKTFDERGTGFSERIAGFSCTSFGRTAQCRVAFEARFDPESQDPLGRGVDGIQLVRNGERWWITSVATEYERPDLPIAAELLSEAGVLAGAENSPLAGCNKLEFDPSKLDEHGLLGPEGGKVALSYEFCVPKDQKLVDQVRAIDATVAIQASSPGRIGCEPTEVLCVGSTYQEGFLDVLAALCDLEYVARIERAVFE